MPHPNHERLDVAIATWAAHRDNHKIMADPECVFCEDDPRWKPGRTWDHEANVIYTQGD